MQVKYILYLAILVLLEREFGVSGKNVTKNTVTPNAKVENVTTRSVSKKAKTYSSNNKRKQQYNVQIIAEPDQSYLDRYKKKNYLPSNIITKANFTKNDYDNMLNDPKFDKKYVKKKRKKTPSSVNIYYGSSTTVAPGAPFIESTPQNDISPSFLNHMLSIHESTTKKPSKSEKDYYKYLVDDNYNKYPYRLVTEQTVSSSTTRPTTISRPNVLYFSTTTTTTSSPTSLLNTYGSTIRPYYPLPTYQSATVEDSIKRPTTATSPLSVTTPVIDLNDVVLKLLKNDTNKTMLKDLLQLNCTTPPATKKNPVKQLDEDEEDELIANQSTDRKKGVAIFDIKSAEEEKEHDESDEEEEDDFSLDDIPEVKGDKKKDKKDKKGHDKKKTTKKKKHKKKKEHHHHEKKKKKKKHHHHDYDYKKKVKKGMKDVLDEFQGAAELIYDMIFNPFDLKPDKKVVGKKKKVIKEKHCHSKEEHNHYYYVKDDKHSDEHEYHDKDESYEKHKHKHHKKKKHHHKKHEDSSDEHDSYEYRSIAKRDVNASSSGLTKRGTNETKVLRTKIHVTSEFASPEIRSTTAPTVNDESGDGKSEKSSQEDTSSYEDDYGFNMGFGDDYDSRDVSKTSREDSEYYSDEYSSKEKKKNDKKISREKSPKKKKYDDDYDDDYEPEGFFDMIISSVGRFFASFMPGATVKKPKRKHYDSYEDDSDEGPSGRSTTPRIDYRKPKKPSYMEQRRPKDPWYYPTYLFSSSENNEIVVLPTASPLMGVTTTERSSWMSNLNPLNIFTIFSSDDNQIVATTTTEPSNDGMFNWMPSFLSPATTIPPPVISSGQDSIQINLPKPLQDPATWVGILQALQNATVQTTEQPSYNIMAPPKVHSDVKSYANHQVWRVLPRTQDHINALSEHKKDENGIKLTWLKGPSLRGPTDVIVSPENLENFKEFLDDEGIPFDITVWDLEKAIKYENPPLRYSMMSTEHPLTWYHYHRYSDILKFMEYLQRNFPNNVELIPIGSSYEGMPLNVVKIFSSENSDEKQRKNDKKSHEKRKKMKKRVTKPAIFIEAGAHGREWVGPAAATWIINHLLDSIHKGNVSKNLMSVDWYIMPLLNPDGYEYSHSYDRMWRKTRTKAEKKDSLLTAAMNWLQTDDDDPEQIAALKKYCYGADLNRNWDESWNIVGSSEDPCNDNYAGASPFSEPESKALSKFLTEHRKKFKVYVSLHSYGQLIAYPPSPSSAYVSERYDDLFDMAMVSLEKLRNSGSPTKYLIDTSSDMIYHRSGSSDSYAMHQIGIPYAFTVELRGTNGPILPANQIEMAARDAFYLIQGMVEYI